MASIARYAIAIASSFENACRLVAELIASKIQIEKIAIIGEQKSFARACSTELLQIGGNRVGSPQIDSASSDPANILSFGQIAHEVLPSWATRNAISLRHSLDRWLAPAHARRLSIAVGEGAFLIWVELKNASDEQTATRCLLRNSQTGVAVHDFFLP